MKIENKTSSYIYEHLKKFNLHAKGKNRENALKLKYSLDYYINNKKASLEEVSFLFGIDPEVVSKYLRRIGVEPYKRSLEPSIDVHVFDNIDTEEKAYWLGFFFADGCLQSYPEDKSRMRYVFSINLSIKDIEHLRKLNKFFRYQGDKVRVYESRGKEYCLWSIGNRHLWETLNKLGCTPRKTHTLGFPNIPKELYRHFIRGVFDGDGTLGAYGARKQKSCSLIGNKSLIERIQLESEGDGSIYQYKHHPENIKTLSFTSNRVVRFTEYIYKDSTVHLERKYNKYLEFIK